MRQRTGSSRSSSRLGAELDVLLPAEKIRDRVAEVAQEIDRYYQGREVLVIIVLRGAFVFAADLIRSLDTPVRVDFVHLSSYGDDADTSHCVSIISDMREPVRGHEVLIVEDIVDTGCCMEFLVRLLRERGARDVRICALLDKPSRREVNVEVSFVGFVIPDVFVVGYGIDYAQRYRSLPDVCALEPEG